MLKKLNRTTARIPQVRPVKVLQFGGGNFLRGFADWIIDVLNEKTDFNGAIDIITSITPGTAEHINEQEGLYHLVQQGFQDGEKMSETRLITAVNRAINPSNAFDLFLESARNPDLRFIISNTTEAGISFDANDNNPDVLPSSYPGKLTLLLYHRFKHFEGALDKTMIVLPCELIEQNGNTLRELVLQYARYWKLPEAFVSWITKNVFCNTLVDRIVPGFPKDQVDAIQNETGFDDKLIVAAEPFYFWAIEASGDVRKEFPATIAGLNNVIFTNDITPYRTRKVRILNGAHTALVPVAYLRGLRTVKEAMDDPFVSEFIQDTINEEIIPTLDLPQHELSEFANAVADRFRNPFIKHQLQSIALNSISKFKVRVLPTMLEYVRRKGELPKNLAMSLAALICFYRGSWNGDTIPLNDSENAIAAIQESWNAGSIENTVEKVLSNTSLWEYDLMEVPGLSEHVVGNVKRFLREVPVRP